MSNLVHCDSIKVDSSNIWLKDGTAHSYCNYNKLFTNEGNQPCLYKGLLYLICFLSFSIVNIQAVNAQNNFSKILPAHTAHFTSEDLPSICIDKIFQDSIGRLWLSTCNYLRDINRIHLLQWDGYDFSIRD